MNARSMFWEVALGACFVLTTGLAVQGQYISLTDTQVARLRTLIQEDKEAGRRFASLREDADAALQEKPHPIKTIQSQGKLPSNPARIRTHESLDDMPKVRALGWAYAGTGEPRYADKAREFILAWASKNEPTGQPIDETKFEPIFVAHDLTRSRFSGDDKKTVHQWMRKIADEEIANEKEKASTSINNWHSHRLKIIGLIGYALGDKQLIERAVEGYKRQVHDNLRPDGSTFDFHERDALHYHCYDLEPLLALALVASQNGVDLYHYESPGGASLGKSVRFLVPYCDGTKTHAEFVHSKVEFDNKRAEAGDEHFEAGRPFDPKRGAAVLEAAAFFDDSLLPVYFSAAGKRPSKFASWQLVLHAVRRK